MVGIDEEMIRKNDIEEIERLLQDIDDKEKVKILNQKFQQGQTALHLASSEGHFELVCLLLQNGSEINAQDKNHWTPLHCAAQKFQLEICDILLQQGADVLILTEAGTSAFHYLVRGDCKINFNLFNKVAELMLKNGQDINLQNKSGETPLHGACLEGRPVSIRWLIQHNVNVHIPNKYGDTPLHFAARKGVEESVSFLLDAGADPEISGSYGTPRSVAADDKQVRIVKIIDDFVGNQTNKNIIGDESSDEEDQININFRPDPTLHSTSKSRRKGNNNNRGANLRNGPINTPPSQRKLRHIQSIAIRNLHAIDKANTKLRDVYFTLHRSSSVNNNNNNFSSTPDVESNFDSSSQSIFYQSRVAKNTVNPTWDFSQCSREIGDELRNSIVRFTFRLWDCSPDRSDPVCIIETAIRLYRLSYVGKLNEITFPSMIISFELLDGYYVRDDVALILSETNTFRPLDPSKPPPPSSSKKTYNYQTLQKIIEAYKLLGATKEENKRLQLELDQRLPAHIDYLSKKRKRELLVARMKRLTQERDRQLDLLNNEKRELEEMKREILPKTQMIAKALVPLLASKQMFQECLKELKSEKEGLAAAEDALEMRQSTLIRQLRSIFPITQSQQNKLCINGIKLPNSDNFAGNDEEQIATALGFVCQILSMLSKWLEVPLRYPMTPISSRSYIKDEISHPTANSKFPLYSKGVERTRFEYGVYLLNKNLEQMLNSQGLDIITLRHILPNLQLFLVSKGKSNQFLAKKN